MTKIKKFASDPVRRIVLSYGEWIIAHFGEEATIANARARIDS